MDEKTYIKFIVAQIEALRTSARDVLDEDHDVVIALDELLDTISSRRVTPAGFTDESFDATLEEQVDQELVNALDNGGENVVGIVQNVETGEYVEVGNAEAINLANQAVEDLENRADFDDYNDDNADYNDVDDYYDEELVPHGVRETDNYITVTYTRLDENELTDDQVKNIIEHPISNALNKLGAIQLVTVKNTENVAKKEALFAIMEQGELSLKTLAYGIASYRGITIFPGIGQVQAVGSVNFV